MPFITSKAAGGFGVSYSLGNNSIVNSAVAGEQLYATPGTYSWTCPVGVNIISVVCVGGGGGGVYKAGGAFGGGGGGLGYKNNIIVTPGLTYTVTVGAGGTTSATSAGTGGDSYFINTTTVVGRGGTGANTVTGGTGGSYVGDGGGSGGAGGVRTNGSGAGGGGGAGGYSGKGGDGSGGTAGSSGQTGAGGGGGGGCASNNGTYNYNGGGGVGVYGEGANGAGGAYGASSADCAQGGSGGQSAQSTAGALYGGGGAGRSSGPVGSNLGGNGAVRIVWAGPPARRNRVFPSTRVIAPAYSVQFNGTNQYLSVAHQSALVPAGVNFTIECWVYITSFSNFNHIYNKGGGTAGGLYFGINTDRKLYFGFSNTSSVTANTPLSLNTWTHVAFTRGLTDSINFWKDGIKDTVGTPAVGTSMSGTAELRIGRGAGASTEYFNGYISNLRFVKSEAVYTSNFTPPTAPLQIIGATNLLTCKSSTIIDEGTGPYAITNNNGAVVSTTMNPWY